MTIIITTYLEKLNILHLKRLLISSKCILILLYGLEAFPLINLTSAPLILL